ncbi:MAG: redoxin domain-containing protein [Alphaproteobacteria bacterium]|nr:redoxin domain-containing protein [Alphaproteobacteria bacterium]
MNHKVVYFLAAMVMALVFIGASAKAAVEIGKPVPNFEAVDIKGDTFRLDDQKGKIIVLEWSNHECPFVGKHYNSGNMQKTQKAALDAGAEWVTIVSSAPGHQGHLSPEESAKVLEENGSTPSAKIMDESGAIGRLFGARTTPHMFVIDEKGVLAYAGAIDSNSSPNPATIEGAENYVLAALEEVKAGKPVTRAQTEPYGCAVKYGK